MPGLVDTCECRVHRARRARGAPTTFGHRKMCTDLRRKLFNDLAKGMSVNRAAQVYGLHHSTVQWYANRYWYRVQGARERFEAEYLAAAGLLPPPEQRIGPFPGQWGHPDFFDDRPRVIGVPNP